MIGSNLKMVAIAADLHGRLKQAALDAHKTIQQFVAEALERALAPLSQKRRAR
jgi:predicted HicB family RNase H-like nuclease